MKDLTPIDEHDVLLREKQQRAEKGLMVTGSHNQDTLRSLLGVGNFWGVDESVDVITQERMERKRQRYERCLPVANDILEEACASLAIHFRFLDRALWRMPLVSSFDIFGICSDGMKLYYDPEYVVNRFKLSPNEVVRDVIHCLFHCIFRHPFMLYSVMREPWDVSCDIAIESMLIDLLGETFPSNYDGRAKRTLRIICAQVGGVITAERLYHFFSGEGNRADLRSLAPMFRHDSHGLWYADACEGQGTGVPSVARQQTQEDQGGALPEAQDMTPDQVKDMVNSHPRGNAQTTDTLDADAQDDSLQDALRDSSQDDSAQSDADNEASRKDNEGANSEDDNKQGNAEAGSGASGTTSDAFAEERVGQEELAAAWQEIAQRIQVEVETTVVERGSEAGNLVAQLRAVNREKQNYEAFLRRFSVLRERMMVNADEFDYIYYTFGMKRYGNMPLIEPLEYKDARGIHDFAIVIDTSESCSGDMVQAFVRKTYNILRQAESFHSRVNIHIIQCDVRVQSDKKIESLADLDLYLERMELRGFGGTDFRPAFEYVNLLCEKREFVDLRGLVYFTDGQGIFPRNQPKYDAVFVFLDDGYSDPQVPPWALKLILDERQLQVPPARPERGGRAL